MAMVRKSNAISNTKKMWTGSLLISVSYTHLLSYMVDYEGYRETVSAFMKKIGCETDRETERSE